MNYTKAQFIRHTLAGLFTLSLVILGVTFTPQIQRQMLASDLSENVFQVTSLQRRGSGTAFYVKAKSGKTVVVTNAHVCQGAPAMLKIINKDDKYDFVELKKIKEAPYKDLCALESDKKSGGLGLASTVARFEDSYVFGYPAGYEYFSKGMIQREVSSYEVKYNVVEHECPGEYKDFRQAQPQNIFEALQLMTLLSQGIETGCRVKNNLLMTSNIAYPGISGSPVVNKFGNIVGVVARYSPEIISGMMVQRDALKEFLSDL